MTGEAQKSLPLLSDKELAERIVYVFLKCKGSLNDFAYVLEKIMPDIKAMGVPALSQALAERDALESSLWEAVQHMCCFMDEGEGPCPVDSVSTCPETGVGVGDGAYTALLVDCPFEECIARRPPGAEVLSVEDRLSSKVNCWFEYFRAGGKARRPTE